MTESWQILFAVTPERFAHGTTPADAGFFQQVAASYQEFTTVRMGQHLPVDMAHLSGPAKRLAAGIRATMPGAGPVSTVLVRPYTGQPLLLDWQWDALGADESPEQYLERHAQAMLQVGEIAHVALEPMPWLDAKDLVERLQMSRRQIGRLCAAKFFPSAVKRAGGWQVQLVDLLLVPTRPHPGRPAKVKPYAAVVGGRERLAVVDARSVAEARTNLRPVLQEQPALYEQWQAAGEQVRLLRRSTTVRRVVIPVHTGVTTKD